MSTVSYIKRCQQLVQVTLSKKLPTANQGPRQLHQAMRYAVLNGGKRIRSAFIYASGEALGAKSAVLHDISAAMEMVHAFSLVHDDLPALDNDDLRRGKPTCHKVFGEATAILTGDALHSLAFEILAKLNSKSVTTASKVEMIKLFSHAIGSKGMAGGEELDLRMVNKKASVKKIEAMYKLKTGCLLSASVLMGALAANCTDKKILRNLTNFSECIGLAFQIHDDIIGIESDTKTLGKKQGNDLALNKPVYPVIAGMARAKKREQMLYKKAIAYLDNTGINYQRLKDISNFIIERNY